MAIAQPSIDPANNDSMVGMLRFVFGKLLRDVDDMLPAEVVAFNGNRNDPRVTVKPMVRLVTTEGELVSRAQIASVPVLTMGAGGYVHSFPINPGDRGWIKASDRDISLYLQGLAETGPNTKRMHSFEDGLFIPDVHEAVTVAAEDQSNPVWQSKDGAVCIALWPEFVKIRAGRGLFVSDQPGEPEQNVIAQFDSTLKASIPWPRMTQAQRDAIPNPVSGMAVWNTDTDALNTYAHGAWS